MDVHPSRAWLQWILGIVGLAMGVVAAGMVFHGRTPPRAPAPTQRRHVPTATTPLYVQHVGRSLQLHWDRDVQATSGAIRIQDGAKETVLDLSPQELRAGVATYWPESPDVMFFLELEGGVVGAIRAPAQAPVADARPSPFGEKPRPRRAATKPVKLVPRFVEDEEERPKRSRLGRVAAKIPLIRRLQKH